MRYHIVIECGSDTDAFGVVVPDLPGCFSAGDTFDEAVTNAAEAIAMWVEDALDQGQEIPHPSSLDDLRKRADWAGPEWIWGFASVDPALFDDTTERVKITLSRRILARLDSRAREAGETRSGFIAKMALMR
nr:type II toxin-antitoxin system HicB family antitoxin [Granulibacter bethesdensis]